MPRLTIHVAGCPRAACYIPRPLTRAEQNALEWEAAALTEPHGPESANPFDPSPLESALIALLMQWRRRLSSDG